MLRAKNEQAGGAAVDVPEFALAQVPLDRVRTALDVGCGWGRFARPLAHRGTIGLTCMDVWPGMVESCRQTLADAGLRASYIVGDARAIPAQDAAFDLVMANHMLYEFDRADVGQVIAELNRVVASDGTLLATTYADAEPVPMTELHNETLAMLGFPRPGSQPLTFSLENGTDLLSAGFADVLTHVMEEMRSESDADALTALYLKTGGYQWAANYDVIPERDRARIPDLFRARAQERIDRQGPIATLTKWTTFLARSPHRRSGT